jgi:Leucine-rich repeat (LRR) protein
MLALENTDPHLVPAPDRGSLPRGCFLLDGIGLHYNAGGNAIFNDDTQQMASICRTNAAFTPSIFTLIAGSDHGCAVMNNGSCFTEKTDMAYMNNAACKWCTNDDAVLVAVEPFHTEENFDILEIIGNNGSQNYSGTSGPNGVAVLAGSVLTFTSDWFGHEDGFYYCAEGTNFTMAPTVAPGAQALIPATERSALMDLYVALDGSNWLGCDQWGIGDPCEQGWGSWGAGENRQGEKCVVCQDGHVEMLQLCNNNLVGEIPSSIGNLTRLLKLDVTNNRISGEIPVTIQNITGLMVLWVGVNNISGPLLETLAPLTRLAMVDAPGNAINGTIPSDIGTWTDLNALWMANNQLSGPIPASLGNCSKLGGQHDYSQWPRVTLDHNRLSGRIPASFARLDWGSALPLLTHNDLTGAVPEEFCGKNATYIALFAHNNFTAVPGCLFHPPAQTVDLSNNRLTLIPSEICESSALMSFAAAHNDLVDLPTCLGARQPNLVSLDVSNNRITRLPPDLFRHPSTVIVSSNNITQQFPADMNFGDALLQFVAGRNHFTGGLPPALVGAPNLRFLDLSHSQLTGPVPPEICNATALQVCALQDNHLTGVLPGCIFDSTTLPVLATLKIGCQNSENVLPFEACPPPFEMAASGPGSMAALMASIPTLARTDVVPHPTENLRGVSSAPAPLDPDYSIGLNELSVAVGVICGTLGLTVLLATHVLCGHRGGITVLDKFPQYGSVVDKVEGNLHSHEYLNRGAKGAETGLGGFFNVVKVGLLVFFVVQSIATYCLDGLLLQSSNTPATVFLPAGAINFTLTVGPASGHKPVLLHQVADPWMTDLLEYRGFTPQQALDLTSDAEGSSTYTFPLGWDPLNGTRTLSVWVNSTHLANASGMEWTLTSGAVLQGRAPNSKLADAMPSVSGSARVLPTKNRTCIRYQAVTAPNSAIGYLGNCSNFSAFERFAGGDTGQLWTVPGYEFTVGYGHALPGRTPACAAVTYLGPCAEYASDPVWVVPGRSAPTALFGPDRFFCPKEVKLFITATPRTQFTPYDPLSGTDHFSRKTFDFELTGTASSMHYDYAKSGIWRVPSLYRQRPSGLNKADPAFMCPECVYVDECPPAKITVVISRGKLGLTETLVRQVGVIQFGPALLASCLSLAALFLMGYDLIGSKFNARSQAIGWANQATEAALASGSDAGKIADSDKYQAHSMLSNRRAAGSFTVYSSPDDPNTAILCFWNRKDRDGAIVEIKLKLLGTKAVLLSHPLSPGGGVVEIEFSSMLLAIKTLSVGDVPGAGVVYLTMLLTPTKQERRASTLSMSVSSPITDARNRSMREQQSSTSETSRRVDHRYREFHNPAFHGKLDDDATSDSYLSVAPLNEPLLPQGQD